MSHVDWISWYRRIMDTLQLLSSVQMYKPSRGFLSDSLEPIVTMCADNNAITLSCVRAVFRILDRLLARFAPNGLVTAFVASPSQSAHFVSSSLVRSRRLLCLSLSTKSHRLQLAPLARPHPQKDHEGCRCRLNKPPVQRVRYAVGVKRGDDQMYKVDCQGEVGNEFRTRD